MRFRRGTKVSISWTDPRGRRQVTLRWWNQVDVFIRKFTAEQGRDFKVRGMGWKDWKPYDPREHA